MQVKKEKRMKRKQDERRKDGGNVWKEGKKDIKSSRYY